MAALVDTNILVYGLSWFDAHLWAYAELFGLDLIWSEDFVSPRRNWLRTRPR